MPAYTNNGSTNNPDFNATTTRYNALADKVYDWANRDIAALPPSIVRDSLRYAADTAYRTLRVPALEHTVLWTNETALQTATAGDGNLYQSYTELAVPPDLIEFIHIRGTDDNGLTTRVFNEKTDIRSYWDIIYNRYDPIAFWSRQGDSVLLTPAFGFAGRAFYGGGAGRETQIEMYYYRRLPALDAVYNRTANNWTSGLGTITDPATGTIFRYRAAGDMTPVGTGETISTDANLVTDSPEFPWNGDELVHWLKDENEKIPLMGALGEVFAYLQEDDQAGKYIQLFQKEIADLNDEDRVRDASGGNVQVQYTANGLI